MIRAAGLTKRYGGTTALHSLNLDIARGECLGLTGPNGGGRTTLLRVLATLVRPSAGRVEVDGTDAVRHPELVRPRVAYVGGDAPGGDGLSVREYLAWVTDARRVTGQAGARLTIDEALDRAQLSADMSVDGLPAAARQRLALAAALLVAPPILLLDDPFRTMDDAARNRFIAWLRESRDSGATIVVAFNDDELTGTFCHHTARLDGGRLLSPARTTVSAPRSTPLVALAGGDA